MSSIESSLESLDKYLVFHCLDKNFRPHGFPFYDQGYVFF